MKVDELLEKLQHIEPVGDDIVERREIINYLVRVVPTLDHITELLKRLENVEIDEDERREIINYLVRAVPTHDHITEWYIYHIILKDWRIYDFGSYQDHIESNKVSPDDAYIYVENLIYTKNDVSTYNVAHYYPFLDKSFSLIDAYLSKLGFHHAIYRITPATGLKYVAATNYFSDAKRLVVEVANIYTVAINLNLPRIARNILAESKGLNYLHDDEVEKIVKQLKSQKLFAGYNFSEAKDIVNKYYGSNGTSLAKDIEAIKDAYNRIFEPYRVVYDLKNKQLIST